MFRLIILFCIVLVAVLSTVRAQEPTPTPVPTQAPLPTPVQAEDILTDAVTVVQTLPLWHFDNVSLSVYDETAAQWQRYLLPTEAQTSAMPTIEFNADGTYRVTMCAMTPYTPYYGANNCVWVFDPTTGEFTATNSICSSFSSPSGGWVPYVDPVTYQSHMCNTATGELSAPLPVDLNVLATTGVPFSTITIPVSDALNEAGDTMIISSYGGWQIFNLTTGATTPLGDMLSSVYNQSSIDWVDDTRALFVVASAQATTPRTYEIYLVDVTQPDNEQLLYSGEAITRPNDYYSPRTLQWLASDCAFMELSFDTLEVTSFTIPGVCSQGTPLEDGSGDWLVVQNHRVLRYNREERSVQMLFMDGIGCYDASASPGGRYQVLYFTTTEDCNELAIMDTQSGAIDYLTPYAYYDEHARWIDGDTLLIYDTLDNTDRIVHVATGEVIIIPPVASSFSNSGVAPFSANGHYILVEQEAGTIAVYDMTTNTTTLIAHDVAAYEISLGWQDENILSLWLTNAENVPLARWRLQLGGA